MGVERLQAEYACSLSCVVSGEARELVNEGQVMPNIYVGVYRR